MSKKKSAHSGEPTTRRFLSLENIPTTVYSAYEEVEVPEFGDDEEGHPLVVNVRPVSVLVNNILTKRMNTFGVDDDGAVFSKTNPNHDESCVIAALSAFDDGGSLVFGVDFTDAIERVEGLPSLYRGAIYRIAQSAIGQAQAVRGSQKAVGEAQKN